MGGAMGGAIKTYFFLSNILELIKVGGAINPIYEQDEKVIFHICLSDLFGENTF